jgi:hypothetical protein
MGLLSSIELPHWLMIAGAVLIAMGFWVLHLPGTRKLRLILIHRLYHAQRCRRCQGGSILQATRATDDPRRRAVAAPVRVFENANNLPMLLPASHSIFVPAWEPHISIYAVSELALNSPHRAGGTF